MTLLPGQTLIATAVDERFRIRGPYFRPGDSVLAEPWVALGESNAGHIVIPCARNSQHAYATVARWRALTERGERIDPHRMLVGAAVVNPRGEVVDSWGSVPVPGGPSRWSALYRLAEPRTCECGAQRWPGCWVTRALDGCAECLPLRELDDPRPWPFEPDRVASPAPVVKRKTTGTRKRVSRKAPAIVSPDQGRLE